MASHLVYVTLQARKIGATVCDTEGLLRYSHLMNLRFIDLSWLMNNIRSTIDSFRSVECCHCVTHEALLTACCLL